MADRATRDHIVEAADELFYRQGYEHTSFAHIADAVGISRGNFYHHFKTKDEILEAVIAARLANTRAMLAAWESNDQRPADRIRSFIHILVANQAEIRSAPCALSLPSWNTPRRPRPTSCSPFSGPGLAGSSPCSAARRRPTP